MSAVATSMLRVVINHPSVVGASLQCMHSRLQKTCFADASREIRERVDREVKERKNYESLGQTQQEIVKEKARAYELVKMSVDTEAPGKIVYTRKFEPIKLKSSTAVGFTQVTCFGPNTGIYSEAEKLKEDIDSIFVKLGEALGRTNTFLNVATRVCDPAEPWGKCEDLTGTPFDVGGESFDFSEERTSRVSITFGNYLEVMATAEPIQQPAAWLLE